MLRNPFGSDDCWDNAFAGLQIQTGVRFTTAASPLSRPVVVHRWRKLLCVVPPSLALCSQLLLPFQSSVFRCKPTLNVAAVMAAVVFTEVADSEVVDSMVEAVDSMVGAALAGVDFMEADWVPTTEEGFQVEDSQVADTEVVRPAAIAVGHPADIEADMATAALADSEEAAAPSVGCAPEQVWGVPVTVHGARKDEEVEIHLQDGTPFSEGRI
jgi:hypothetical protein